METQLKWFCLSLLGSTKKSKTNCLKSGKVVQSGCVDSTVRLRVGVVGLRPWDDLSGRVSVSCVIPDKWQNYPMCWHVERAGPLSTPISRRWITHTHPFITTAAEQHSAASYTHTHTHTHTPNTYRDAQWRKQNGITHTSMLLLKTN